MQTLPLTPISGPPAAFLALGGPIARPTRRKGPTRRAVAAGGLGLGVALVLAPKDPWADFLEAHRLALPAMARACERARSAGYLPTDVSCIVRDWPGGRGYLLMTDGREIDGEA